MFFRFLSMWNNKGFFFERGTSIEKNAFIDFSIAVKRNYDKGNLKKKAVDRGLIMVAW